MWANKAFGRHRGTTVQGGGWRRDREHDRLRCCAFVAERRRALCRLLRAARSDRPNCERTGSGTHSRCSGNRQRRRAPCSKQTGHSAISASERQRRDEEWPLPAKIVQPRESPVAAVGACRVRSETTITIKDCRQSVADAASSSAGSKIRTNDQSSRRQDHENRGGEVEVARQQRHAVPSRAKKNIAWPSS